MRIKLICLLLALAAFATTLTACTGGAGFSAG
jgi:predicted small secreted protein